jgi:hypothetical protein
MATREDLHKEIENTRLEFHRLLDRVPPEAYGQPTDNPAWTVGEVLYHITLSLRLFGSNALLIQGPVWLQHLIAALVPRRPYDWLNRELTRLGARHVSSEYLARRYDQAHRATLHALASVAEWDLQKHVHYPDWDPLLSGLVTLEEHFHHVKGHFDAHAAQLGKFAAPSMSPVTTQYVHQESAMKSQFFADYMQRLEDLQRLLHMETSDLPADAMDWSPGPQMNSIAVLLAHIAGIVREGIDLALDEPPSRVRAHEFQTRGVQAAEMLRRLDAVIDHARISLPRLGLEDLEGERMDEDGPITCGWALLHALEHAYLHLGHLQLTCQIWRQQS